MRRLAAFLTGLREAAHLMVGLPSYEGYYAHMAAHHPGQPAMSRAAFFRNRQQAHYGGTGGKRCC